MVLRGHQTDSIMIILSKPSGIGTWSTIIDTPYANVARGYWGTPHVKGLISSGGYFAAQ